MPKYSPVDVGFPINAAQSELLTFCLMEPGINGPGFRAGFLLTDRKGKMLTVEFSADSIVRILDEFQLSTENEDSESNGLVPYTFIYRVTGSCFEIGQSPAWRLVDPPLVDNKFPPPIHYRFLTGNMCLDILVALPPKFGLVDIPAELLV